LLLDVHNDLVFKKNLFSYVLYFVFFFTLTNTFSQENLDKTSKLHLDSSIKTSDWNLIRFKYFRINEGLSQATVNDLIQDKFGFIWIATQDGLNRFDGTEFKHFKPIKFDSTSISGNYIVKLFQDKWNNIWVGTNSAGLCYYNPKLEIFYKVALEKSKSHSETITDITQDLLGNIWISSTSGLFRLKITKTGKIEKQNILINNAITALHVDSENTLWLGDSDGNIYKHNKPLSNAINPKVEFKIKGTVKSFYKTTNTLLIGSDFGLYNHNFKTKNTQLIKLSSTNNSGLKFIKEFLPKNNESIWIATGSGLLLYNHITKKVLKQINNSTDKKAGLTSGSVYSLLQLKNNQLLVGTSNGLNLLDFEEPVFKNISKNNLGMHLLNDNVVFSVLKDKNDLWIGTSDGGLNLIRNNKSYYFTENENDPNSISGNVVRAIKKDTINNRLWLATTRGLSMIDLKTFSLTNPKFTVFHHDSNNLNSINDDYLKDIVLDSDNNLWCATFSKGIFKMELDTNKKVTITRYVHQKNNANSLRSNFTNCIRVSKSNTIWIGSKKGISQLTFNNLKSPVFSNFFKVEKQQKSLSNNSVYDILLDKNENIWIGTRDGLNLFLGDNKFESWQKQKQFPNTIIYSLQDDDNGNIWMGTNDGLIYFNTQNKIFKRYSVADGIQSNEFNSHARFKDNNGLLYINGIGGVTYFNPKDIKKIDTEEPLYFSQLRIKEQLITPNQNKHSVLKKSLIYTTELELKYNQFPFYLKFSSINFQFNNHVSYAYKIKEQTSDWNSLYSKEISFLQLSPGQYTLQVNGFTRGKLWQQKPLEMILIISPPWYKTWWSYLLYTIIFLTLMYLLHRFNLNRKLRVVEKQKTIELVNLRSKMYANISHEFKTPLTLINGLSELLLKENKNNIDQEKLKGISYSGKRLLNLVNQMLGLITIDKQKEVVVYKNGNIIAFLKKIISVYKNVNNKAQEFLFTTNVQELTMDFDDDKLQKIMNNLISNAIKFTPEKGKIYVDVHKENDRLRITIKDTGTGIKAKHLPHIFERFYKTFDTENNLGNGIGMALTKELVQLLNGTIKVASKLKKGTVFTITLPINNNSNTTKETINHNPNIDFLEEITFNGNQAIKKENTVLIVEDNNAIRNFIKILLGNTYNIQTAKNGVEGLKIAQNKKIDFIISDVRMPKMNGLEFCKAIKNNVLTSHIPFVIISAKTSDKDRLKGFELGIDAYLNKPFNNEELLLIIKNLLQKRKDQILYFEKLLDIKEHTQITTSINRLDIDFIKAIQEIALSKTTVNADEIAYKLATSRTQLHRKIKSLTGKSITQYINHIRVEKGKILLKNKSLHINEIAYELGFESTNYFSRVFKKETGKSPLSFRKDL